MTTISCHELINTHFAEPIFKGWEPSEWDMKYHYNTPRRLKKLDSDKAKHDAKLRVPFEKKHAQWETVHANIDEIATYPKEIVELFLNTFEWTISDLVRRHEHFLNVKQQLIDTYGQDVYDICRQHLMYDMHPYVNYSRAKDPVILDDKKFQELAISRTYGTNFHQISEDTWDYDYPLTKVTDPKALMELCITYIYAHEADQVRAYGTEAYVSAIIHMSDTLGRILKDINRCFGGNKPTECLTDAGWGAKGEFNGILTDGHKKISFKSFGAGGYNIQKFHYRFKITELKR